MQFGRQGVYHGRANTVQATRCGIGLAGKFAPCMQRCQDHLNRRFAGEFRMFTYRHAPAIIADGQPVCGLQIDVDAVGMASYRLIHRIVQDFGCQMVQGAFIRAANIHARAVPDGLQPLQYLDIRGIIPFSICRGTKQIGHNSPVFHASWLQDVHAPPRNRLPGTGGPTGLSTVSCGGVKDGTRDIAAPAGAFFPST